MAESGTARDLSDALRRSDPRLSKYNPLPRILTFDDFNQGTNGWVELSGNYDGTGSLDSIDPQFIDMRPPQLSNANFFDVGTHGAVTGTYSLKLATRPQAGHTAVGIRRLTMAARGLVQIEAYLCYKAEATLGGGIENNTFGEITFDANQHPSEAQFGAFTVATDICGDGGIRYHNVMRFQNTDEDHRLVRRWMYPTVPEPTPHERLGEHHDYGPLADFTAPNPADWATVADDQETCYNEVPTKTNWHYIRFVIDTEARRNVELQFNDRVIDLRDVPVPPYPDRWKALGNLLNFYFSVRTLSNHRNFLFIDSVVISTDW
ncbi:hypothetical protein E4V99_04845 [Microbacterium sp. dk485]|uniref:DUF6772 family protein n=1 Tax=Microbacterium sp. dk485 TaxID=2560021 RepID=UPI0010739634|nr:DUF6772 family protein [Microbacterium sp. dk485]TFV84394.1 hypothetical protein E4V99_04845 [Microbacterium sp. dk485]